MPFEPAPKDVSLADKLAALIEIGRATNPDAKHIRNWGDGKTSGCAMTFAAMGAGFSALRGGELADKLADILNANYGEVHALMGKVISMNDDARAPLEDIVKALREGKFPEGTHRAHPLDQYIVTSPAFYDAFSKIYAEEMAKISKKVFKSYVSLMPIGDVVYIGTDYAADSWTPLPKLPTKAALSPKPFKPNVRKSARTGATWPKPKHAYA